MQPRFIVALWGIETSYGSWSGKYSGLGALATLAHEGRRAAFFRKRAAARPRSPTRATSTPATCTGSWAGAMGQSQFMPSSYLATPDFDGDGRRDIGRSPARHLRLGRQLSRRRRLEHRPAWGRPVHCWSGWRRARPAPR